MGVEVRDSLRAVVDGILLSLHDAYRIDAVEIL
jgi:hypothetical protein